MYHVWFLVLEFEYTTQGSFKLCLLDCSTLKELIKQIKQFKIQLQLKVSCTKGTIQVVMCSMT